MASLVALHEIIPGTVSRMSQSPPVIPGISALVDDFDGFVLDIWGVIHDGCALYPGVVEALDGLIEAGKSFVMLSNAPSRVGVVSDMLVGFGMPDRHCRPVVSSGEATWQALKTRSDPWHAALGRRCFLMGAQRDSGLLKDLNIDHVKSLADADFIVNTGPYCIEATVPDYEIDLAAAAALGLPMICANPDVSVMRGSGRAICAGALAQRYEALGGRVHYHGKPHAAIYRECFARLPGIARKRILAIGDTLATDIAGAGAAGLASALVPGGIHSAELACAHGAVPEPQAVAYLCARVGHRPDFVLPSLTW